MYWQELKHRMLQSKIFIVFYNPAELWQTNLWTLSHFFHYPGKLWYWRLRGYEVDDFEANTFSIGHSFILPPELRTPRGAKQVLTKLVSKVGYRLRKEQFLAGALSLRINLSFQPPVRQFISFPLIADSQNLLAYGLHLFEKIPLTNKPLGMYLVAFKLQKSHRQPSLFPQMQKLSNLSYAVDEINDEFGPGTIYLAEAGDPNIAPDRIPFGKVRYDIKQ